MHCLLVVLKVCFLIWFDNFAWRPSITLPLRQNRVLTVQCPDCVSNTELPRCLNWACVLINTEYFLLVSFGLPAAIRKSQRKFYKSFSLSILGFPCNVDFPVL